MPNTNNKTTYKQAYQSLLSMVNDFIPTIKDINHIRGKNQVLEQLEKSINHYTETSIYSLDLETSLERHKRLK